MKNAPLSSAVELYLVRGLAIQPFVAGLVGAALFRGWIVMGVLVGVVATLITVLVAFPTLLWILKRGPLTLHTTLISGMLLGNIPAALAAVLPLMTGRQPSELASLIRPSAFGSIVGVVSAASFWYAAGRHIAAEQRNAS